MRIPVSTFVERSGDAAVELIRRALIKEEEECISPNETLCKRNAEKSIARLQNT